MPGCLNCSKLLQSNSYVAYGAAAAAAVMPQVVSLCLLVWVSALVKEMICTVR